MKLSIFIIFFIVTVQGDDSGEVSSKNIFSPTITLIATPDDYHLSINKEFERIARGMGFTVRPYFISGNEINQTITLAEKQLNVINLKISIKDLHSDYDRYYQKFLYSPLLCATNCENENVTYTRLVIIDMLYQPRLLQLLETENLDEDFIQICLPTNIPEIPIDLFTENIRWPIKIVVDKCIGDVSYSNEMIALITHGPSDTQPELPTIFYQPSYDNPKVGDRYSWSISPSLPWQSLKYAFKEFFVHMGWYRVAILSDDTQHSLNFLQDLTPLFVQERIIFTDQRCAGRLCDFYYPLNFLKEHDPRILIVNVGKRNSKKLVDTINSLQLQGVTWVVRDWPFEELPMAMTDVFSLTLAPVYTEADKLFPHLSSIKRGIQIIDSIYKHVLGDTEQFRSFFAKLTEHGFPTQPLKTNAYITRIVRNAAPTLLSLMTIEDGDITYTNLTSEYKEIIPDVSQKCIVRSNNYFKPCDHAKLLLLVGIWIVFAFSLLLVILFFNKYRSSRYYNRFA